MNVVFLDSSVELVPEEISGHPSVVKNARKFGKNPTEVLLDISLHYYAMSKLSNKEKRGRPDILHNALTMLLTYPSFQGEVYVHTVDSKIIWVSSKMRPPKNYLRFVGLMEQLLVNGRIPPTGDALMEVTNLTLSEVVKDEGLIVLDEKGDRTDANSLCQRREFIGIGAFPHGDFSEEVKRSSKTFLSVSDKVLETQHVVCKLLSACF
ncbi:16S rRNA methyltransferase [Metallosphaera tengchongensis]|uniref:Ribosomal RNA small subunit methyltransferase Nep1 n=1 Tax=Metallosphaera tengchongensis TaxID=1532350 RepID=A0A6N0NXT3_9CREN|nr:16S rRNA methyltransferase [Metallosphaera tengchongensis]QKR00409.1 16S rRNA methyltransferase [Metallosphaera tengchongensis]